MSKKQKSYVIKVPVYTSEIIENAQDLFGGITYNDMHQYLEKNLKNFTENEPLSFDNRNKTKRTVIDKVDYSVHDSGINKALLLKISAYSTNLYDGYFEAEEKINFQKDYKIGSDTNFIMIYPVIKGIDRTKYNHYFIILIYEDPTKNNEEIAKIAKVVLGKILRTPIANIKLPTLLEELRTIPTIPDLKIKYSSIYNNENEVDVKYREYLVDGKIKKEKEDHFKNIPFNKAEQLINETEEDGYQKKEAKLTVGKKEYKITKELINEASDVLKEAAEKVFNATTSITQEELDNDVHNIDFIFSKLLPILENYMSTNDEN